MIVMRLIAALVLSAASLIPGTVHAQGGGVEIGSLTCRIDGGSSFVFGSTRRLTCTFERLGGKPAEYYAGQIKRFGLDIGVTGETILGWAVFAPKRGLEDYALAGTYAGVAADASVGLGAGAKVLVGGSNDSISLQPLSLQGQSGLNLAVTVAELRLHPSR